MHISEQFAMQVWRHQVQKLLARVLLGGTNLAAEIEACMHLGLIEINAGIPPSYTLVQASLSFQYLTVMTK